MSSRSLAGAAFLASVLLTAFPAHAQNFSCLDNAAIAWDGEKPALHRLDIDQELSGAVEFGLDTSTGEWTEHLVGSRPGITGGGRFVIISDGRGYRSEWVGVELELGESIRLRIAEQPFVYVRVRREMGVSTGVCVLDDEQRPQAGELALE